MADRMADGTLAERLKGLRAAGESWEAIARQLYDECGIEVSGQTLRTWGLALGLREDEVPPDEAGEVVAKAEVG